MAKSKRRRLVMVDETPVDVQGGITDEEVKEYFQRATRDLPELDEEDRLDDKAKEE